MSVDRILDLIDAGLQHSTEGGMSLGDPAKCARCLRHEPTDGDLCVGCRSYLLDDSEVDPVRGGPTDMTAQRFEQLRRHSVTVHIEVDTRPLAEVVNRVMSDLGATRLSDVDAERVRLRAEQCMPRDTGLLFRNITANS